MKAKTHVIDLIFPIALFFVFAASALMVLLLSANIYSKNTNHAQADDERYTTLFYLSEKIRQNDTKGAISISTQEGIDCLTITADYSGIRYVTYIYEYDGMLKELFVQEGISASLSSGQNIMVSHGLTMEEIGTGIFQFTVQDADGQTSSLIATERSSS